MGTGTFPTTAANRPLAARPPLRVDERDTMFARMERRPGTPEYADYYTVRRSDLRAVDDRLRAMPPLLAPGGEHYDAAIAAETREWFSRIGGIRPDPGVVRHWCAEIAGAPDPTARVKDMARALGAVAAGGAPLDPAFAYTAKGRFDEDYGRPVPLDHPHVLVFLVEMDLAAMRAAPTAPAIRESARQYYRAAKVAITAAEVFRALGRNARPHYDAHYEVILPPLAVRAGLGELGRNNILVADRYGSRVRIGAVTTDFPLRHDRPIDLGVRAFCRACRKCADNCPSGALSKGDPEPVRGALKWPTNVERCYRFWLRAGTDCGVCMACCPFSHADNAFHNFVRRVARTTPGAARFLRRCDDLVYGRKW